MIGEAPQKNRLGRDCHCQSLLPLLGFKRGDEKDDFCASTGNRSQGLFQVVQFKKEEFLRKGEILLQ